MSRLTVFHENSPSEKIAELTSFEDISNAVTSAGLRIERWQTEHPLTPNAPPEEVLKAYDSSIKKLMSEHGYVAVDVVSISQNSENIEAMRSKFLSEHTHSEDEVRFFVDGSGMFYIHKDNKVIMLLCEKGDLVTVPAKTKHWFDMGPRPFFKAIRLFNNPAGWVGNFTQDDIASRFPKYDN